MALSRLAFLLLATCLPCPAGDTYTNPVGDKPVVIGDLFVLQHAGKYYLFGTNAADGFRVSVSTDLVHWADASGITCVINPGQDTAAELLVTVQPQLTLAGLDFHRSAIGQRMPRQRRPIIGDILKTQFRKWLFRHAMDRIQQ